ncbi:ATP-dependent protease LonB [Candidatus Woesearchaeota archaeon]|jgi:ATP-dependent Lon protease|nr:ATP-dependent protease LonB [Candidatus Woesearchaeota archaeon]MBT4322140.1 ATP-dependent protease LonB [Candidatus Woesearchaeota archaeon]MBT4630976.1 ATP-dependent protease LonB [Candidatus Woesearchaeota archaeon]
MSKILKSTKDIKVHKKTYDQVIGQEKALEVVKKAAKQRRHVLLIGEPGTGKSMLGQALAELLPKENLKDIISLNNPEDENVPKIQSVFPGKGKEIINNLRLEQMTSLKSKNIFFIIIIILTILSPWWIRNQYGDIMGAASLIGSMILLAIFVIFFNLSKKMKSSEKGLPKLIINHKNTIQPPFLEATGAHAGALLGDVLHDPFQSGGLGTPAHERVVPGIIHRANKGVLFIDEIATLRPETQQELLTALQEKKYSITGQSERSAGAMVRTEPVPCDFILVAAGNLETVQAMHPALRSRIRGYGYEVYMNNDMPDNLENRKKIAIFVAQEIKKDGKIPPFSSNAIKEIINEAKRRSNKANRLTLHLRDLGGLVRAAGDVAVEENSKLVEPKHIIKAKEYSKTLEHQLADKYIKNKKEYEIIKTKGSIIGRVNGLAVLGTSPHFSGLILPIESEITPGGKKAEFIATGSLGNIAKEAIKNVSAIIMKYFGEDIKEKYDIYVQFLQTHEGVEGDSASIAVATAIISALKKIPIRQDTAMTGSLSVRGDVLAVGGVNSKVEAAIEAGLKQVVIPKANEKDISLPEEKKAKIKIIPVTNIKEVLQHTLDLRKNKNFLRKFK